MLGEALANRLLAMLLHLLTYFLSIPEYSQVFHITPNILFTFLIKKLLFVCSKWSEKEKI